MFHCFRLPVLTYIPGLQSCLCMEFPGHAQDRGDSIGGEHVCKICNIYITSKVYFKTKCNIFDIQ